MWSDHHELSGVPWALVRLLSVIVSPDPVGENLQTMKGRENTKPPGGTFVIVMLIGMPPGQMPRHPAPSVVVDPPQVHVEHSGEFRLNADIFITQQ